MVFKTIGVSDGKVQLSRESRGLLCNLLRSKTFIQQLGIPNLEFTELLFEPIPPSQIYPKGMPIELERYYSSDDYLIINVPPNFLFKANILQPTRLCAIYRQIPKFKNHLDELNIVVD